MMANNLIIDNNEFAVAILQVHPYKSISRMQFVQLLSTPGPKEKYSYWQQVCVTLCEMKNLPKPNRQFFKQAHRLFMENIVEIQKIIYEYIISLPLDKAQDADVLEFFYKQRDKVRDDVDEKRRKLKRDN
ncbi:hypothetical protein PV327_005326 [Microctonus hyperodae]|uniref:Uncharacterized protein n=1 Tax=Microctonus hyperodae TaxID=165561 RepID=A0AA39KZF3_MICHY|nr:hypothetical protein PV327_005326 [Microctonus hyperodae]